MTLFLLCALLLVGTLAWLLWQRAQCLPDLDDFMDKEEQ